MASLLVLGTNVSAVIACPGHCTLRWRGLNHDPAHLDATRGPGQGIHQDMIWDVGTGFSRQRSLIQQQSMQLRPSEQEACPCVHDGAQRSL